MPEEGVHEPYKPYHKIKIFSPKEGVEFPKTDLEIVNTAKQIVSAKGKVLLPTQLAQLEEGFKELYDYQHREGGWVGMSPPQLDFLYQQYGLKRDELEGKTGFNSFGLYALSYLDGIKTMGVEQGYLGTGGWEHKVKSQYRTLLLGCSSITTADQFFRFCQAVNPKMLAIATDINPLAVKIAREAVPTTNDRCQVVESDAQRIPLENESVDFIATNFLVLNLVDRFGSDKDTLQQVLNETARVLSPKGRLVMVEQLKRIDLEWLNYWAGKSGLTLVTGGPDGGINRPATILTSPSVFNRVIADIPGFIKESAGEVEHKLTRGFEKDPREYFGGKALNSATTLIFKKSTR